MDDKGNQAGGNAWGDDISKERKLALKNLADQQREWAAKPAEARGESAFKDVRLTGAEVFYLAALALAGPGGEVAAGQQKLRDAIHDEFLRYHLKLSALHLEGVDLTTPHSFTGAHLEGAALWGAHLEGATLTEAHLEEAVLVLANLQGATLTNAHLERTRLDGAHLEGAIVTWAHLEGAEVWEAHLEGTCLWGALGGEAVRRERRGPY